MLTLDRENRCGPEMALAFIASAFAGTCAPLNPQYTAAEYEFYLSDLKAKVLLLNQGDPSPAAAVARKLGIPVLDVSALIDEPEEHILGGITLCILLPVRGQACIHAFIRCLEPFAEILCPIYGSMSNPWPL